MPRRRYYRRPVRVVAARKKWATNMKTATLFTRLTTPTSATAAVLASNSTGTASPTPVIVKTGNFKVQGDCSMVAVTGVISPSITVILYVLYLPECLSGSSAQYGTIIEDHPEWVMAWKMLDVNLSATNSTTTQATGFSFSSRLKRNLNSGDTINLVAYVANASTSGNNPDINLRISYGAQFWTCAN